MSVINKMLRDLDSRQVDKGSAAVSKPFAHEGLTAGTLALNVAADGLPRRRSSKTWGLALVLSLSMASVGLLVWMSQRSTSSPDTGSVVASSAPALVRNASAPIAAVPAVTTVVVSPPAMSAVSSASDAAAVPVAGQVSPIVAAAAPTLPSILPPKADPASTVAETAAMPNVKPQTTMGQTTPPVGQLRETSEFSSFKRVNRLGPSAQPVVSTDKAVLPVTPDVAGEALKPRQSAAQEVLSQVQERWALGERAQATALLYTAIDRLEASPTGNSTALATLVREYVRLALIQDQVSAAWAVLSKSEQALADVADIWALRGNVAQRLGFHPEAVRAYLKGLEFRPDEPRWMLGAAVSLAAQGQVGPAADLADKARLAGALRPDVANYLRQLGVAVRTD